MKKASEGSRTSTATKGDKPRKSRRRRVAEIVAGQELTTPAEVIEHADFRGFVREIGVEALDAVAAMPRSSAEKALGKKAAKILEIWGSMGKKKREVLIDAVLEEARSIAERGSFEEGEPSDAPTADETQGS